MCGSLPSLAVPDPLVARNVAAEVLGSSSACAPVRLRRLCPSRDSSTPPPGLGVSVFCPPFSLSGLPPPNAAAERLSPHLSTPLIVRPETRNAFSFSSIAVFLVGVPCFCCNSGPLPLDLTVCALKVAPAPPPYTCRFFPGVSLRLGALSSSSRSYAKINF